MSIFPTVYYKNYDCLLEKKFYHPIVKNQCYKVGLKEENSWKSWKLSKSELFPRDITYHSQAAMLFSLRHRSFPGGVLDGIMVTQKVITQSSLNGVWNRYKYYEQYIGHANIYKQESLF